MQTDSNTETEQAALDGVELVHLPQGALASMMEAQATEQAETAQDAPQAEAQTGSLTAQAGRIRRRLLDAVERIDSFRGFLTGEDAGAPVCLPVTLPAPQAAQLLQGMLADGEDAAAIVELALASVQECALAKELDFIPRKDYHGAPAVTLPLTMSAQQAAFLAQLTAITGSTASGLISLALDNVLEDFLLATAETCPCPLAATVILEQMQAAEAKRQAQAERAAKASKAAAAARAARKGGTKRSKKGGRA